MIPLRDLNPSSKTPWVTWSVMLLCAVVFVFQITQPPEAYRAILAEFGLVPARVSVALNEGAEVTPAITSVFTSMFMHGGILHVVGNLWFLRIFGDNVEDHLGHARYLAFYLFCGVAAAATQWAMGPLSGIPMVGASGAIAGVLGAYAVLFPHARVLTVVPIFVFLHITELPALVLIVLWGVLQFFSGVMSLGMPTGGGVAHWAHIGGLIAGVLLAFAFRTRPRAPDEGYYPDGHYRRG